MSQTRAGSATEAVANTAIGWSVNFTANLIFLPILYDPDRPVYSAFLIGCVFTVISLVRGFLLRRLFNRIKFGNRNDVPGGMEHAP